MRPYTISCLNASLGGSVTTKETLLRIKDWRVNQQRCLTTLNGGNKVPQPERMKMVDELTYNPVV